LTQHLITTDIKLSTCVRCGTYLFACTVDGLKVTADPAPLTVDAYREALLAGLRTFDLLMQGGRPWRLVARGPSSKAPGERDILGAHACGAHPMDAAKVEEVPQNPPAAPVTRYKLVDGRHHRNAPAAASQGRQSPSPVIPAGYANRPRSEPRPFRCQRCRKLIAKGHAWWSIEHPTFRWAVHDGECP
jgi:ferredoxin